VAKEPYTYTEQPIEKALLVGIDRRDADWGIEESLSELGRLVYTVGAEVVGEASQRLGSPNPRSFIGKGKVDEVAEMVKALDVDVVIFDDELSPSQQSNLERELGRAKPDVKVIDRTALILDIFALHATTREGRLQVRLAQNQYLLPRLRGMWAHLAAGRMGGGVGSRFGEGESQLEVDRRMIRRRIDQIKVELKKLQADRALQRSARLGSGAFNIALAGYTNAGKSTLLNRLTDSEVLAYDKLFATLDSTTRRLALAGGGQATLTDTVGFIQKLPTTLVEAFRSTLDEITQADLILHVVDASSPQKAEQMQAVQEVLEQIGAHTIAQMVVFNKCDLLGPPEASSLSRANPGAQLVSAIDGSGIASLLAHIQTVASAKSLLLEVLIPFDKGSLVNLAHQRATVVSERYKPDGTWMQLRLPSALSAQFEPYVDKPKGAADG
jgi:GTP-binding protein HflX